MPAPKTVPVSFAAVDLRFLASIGDSDLLKAPAVHNENVLNCFRLLSPRVYLTCSENTQDKNSCDQPNADNPAKPVLVWLVSVVFRHVQFLTSETDARKKLSLCHEACLSKEKHCLNGNGGEEGNCKRKIIISKIKAGKKLSTSKARFPLISLLPNWLMKKNSENGIVMCECTTFYSFCDYNAIRIVLRSIYYVAMSVWGFMFMGAVSCQALKWFWWKNFSNFHVIRDNFIYWSTATQTALNRTKRSWKSLIFNY